MPITKRKDGYYWGSKGPFKTREKATQVAQAAYSSGYVKKWQDVLKREEVEKLFGRKPQEQTFEESGIKFTDQRTLDEYKKLKSQYPQLTQRLQQLQSQYQTNIPIGTVQSEFERGLKEQRQQQAQQQTQPPVQPRGSKYGASGEGYSWRG